MRTKTNRVEKQAPTMDKAERRTKLPQLQQNSRYSTTSAVSFSCPLSPAGAGRWPGDGAARLLGSSAEHELSSRLRRASIVSQRSITTSKHVTGSKKGNMPRSRKGKEGGERGGGGS